MHTDVTWSHVPVPVAGAWQVYVLAQEVLAQRAQLDAQPGAQESAGLPVNISRPPGRVTTARTCFSGSCSEVYLERAFDGTGLRPGERLSGAKELGETSLMFLVHPTLTISEMKNATTAISRVMKRAQLCPT